MPFVEVSSDMEHSSGSLITISILVSSSCAPFSVINIHADYS